MDGRELMNHEEIIFKYFNNLSQSFQRTQQLILQKHNLSLHTYMSSLPA